MTRPFLLLLLALPIALSAPSFVPRFCVRFKASCEKKPNHMCCRGVIPTTSTTTTTTPSPTISTATTITAPTTVTTTAAVGEEESVTLQSIVAKVEVKEVLEKVTTKVEEEYKNIDEPGEILEAEPSVVDEVIATDDIDSELNLISTTTAKPTKFAPKFCLLLKFNCATRKTHVCCRYPLPGKEAGRRAFLKKPKIHNTQTKAKPKPSAQPKPPSGRPQAVRKNFLSRTKQEKRTSTLAPTSTTSSRTTTKRIAPRRNVLLPRICKRLVVNCRISSRHQCCKGFVSTEETVDEEKEERVKDSTEEVKDNVIDTENEPSSDVLITDDVDNTEEQTENEIVVSKSASVSSSTSRIVQITSPRRPSSSRISLPRRPITSRLSPSSPVKRPNTSFIPKRRHNIASRPVSRIVSASSKPLRQSGQSLFERKRPSFFSPSKSRSTTELAAVTTERASADEETLHFKTESNENIEVGSGIESQSKPESTLLIPESTTILPESTSIVPKSTSIIPKSISTVAKTTSILPQSTSILPQSTSSLPQSTSILPESTSISPESPKIEQESTKTLPEITQATPETTTSKDIKELPQDSKPKEGSKPKEPPHISLESLPFPLDFNDDYNIEDYPELSNPEPLQPVFSTVIKQTSELFSEEPLSPELFPQPHAILGEFVIDSQPIIEIKRPENLPVSPVFIAETQNIVPQFIDSQFILNDELAKERTAEEKQIISDILAVKFDDSNQKPLEFVDKISPQFSLEKHSSQPIFLPNEENLLISVQASSSFPVKDEVQEEKEIVVSHSLVSPVLIPEIKPSPIFIPDTQFNPSHTSPQFILESLPKPINPGFIIETLDETPEFLQNSGPILQEFDLDTLNNPGFITSPLHADFSPPLSLVPKATIEIVPRPEILQPRTNILDPNQITPRVSGECFRFDCLSAPSHFCCAPHQTQKRQTLPQSLPEQFSFLSSFANFPVENIEPFMLQHPGLITATVTRVEKSVQGW